MKIIDLDQNTPEWLEFRRSHVGASDIPVLKLGGKQEVYDLFLQKTQGRDKFVNDAMERGKKLEPEARKVFVDTWGYEMNPVVGVCEESHWLMASFDGWNGEEILEIKCPVSPVKMLETHPSYKRWWWQVQAQMGVSGLKKAFLMAYHPSTYALECIHRDEDAIKEIRVVSERFYKQMVGKVEAPEGGEPLPHREDDDASLAVLKWMEWKQYLKIAEKEESLARQRVLEVAGGLPFECHGVQVKKLFRKGTVDYKSIPSLQEIDLDRYRKQGTEYWEISE